MTLPSHLILLTDRPDPARPASGRLPRLAGRARRVVVPAVVARPRWLVSGDAGDVAGKYGASPPEPRQWAERRLAFFAGHVPRLFISPLRYLIWKQIRNLPGVTAISHTLDCSIAAYAVCAKPRKLQFAARAKDVGGGRGVPIVPCGLTYFRGHEFRARAVPACYLTVPPSLAGSRRNFVTDLVIVKRCEVCEVV